jgi:hypothetical protein
MNTLNLTIKQAWLLALLTAVMPVRANESFPRFGYSFDFTIGKVPLFVNVQWPFGFALYSEGKPESFKNRARENPLFYFPPLFFTGVRF